MRNKRLVSVISFFSIAICSFYLFFTYISRKIEFKAEQNSIDKDGNIDFSKKQVYLESIWKKEAYKFLGSKYTYEEIKERELHLGLDLQGGMYILLEVSNTDLLKEFSKKFNSEKILEIIDESPNQSNEALVKSFYKKFKQEFKDKKLSEVFLNLVENKKISKSSSDAEVIIVLINELDKSIERALEIIKNRIDKFGTNQPVIQHLRGTNRIQVELPGVNNPGRVRRILQGVAKLSFWEVYKLEEISTQLENVNSILLKEELSDSKISKLFSLMNGPFTYKVENQNQIVSLLEREDIKKLLPRNLKWVWDAKKKSFKKDGDGYITVYPLKMDKYGDGVLDGSLISNASVTQDGDGKPAVQIEMNNIGSKKWRKVTARNIGNQIAITLDDKVYSAPKVNVEIPNGNSIIQGNFTYEEARDLVTVLKAGSLPAPVKIVEESIIGPSLGKESQKKGLMSVMISFIAILVFMLAYYAKGGFVANCALMVNILLILGVLAQLNTALTMSGIAGIILTIGMAVDANILIFERIRDELRSGSHIKEAIKAGYKKSFSSIFDSNITTFLIGFILYTVGRGVIKGFAITLMLGIVTSFFTSVFFSRLLLHYMIDSVKKPAFSFYFSYTNSLFKDISIDFIKKRKLAYLFSAFIIFSGFVLIIKNGGLNLGVDFLGGRSYIVAFGKPISTENIKNVLSDSFENQSTEVKTYGANNKLKITTNYLLGEDEEKASEIIKNKIVSGIIEVQTLEYVENFYEDLKENEFAISTSMKVGSSVAQDVIKSAIWAIIISLIAIFLYIGLRFFNWQFGISAVMALFHDVLMIFASLGIANIFGFSIEIDQVFLASILTVIGYSINDTVVVFDRVREVCDKKTISSESINNAISSTLSRTLITSFTTFMATLVLLIFGGISLRGFSFSLLLGVIFGTYSSIFIAAPLAFDIRRKNLIKKNGEF